MPPERDKKNRSDNKPAEVPFVYQDSGDDCLSSIGPCFQLDSGRRVYLQQLFVKSTLEGVLTASAHLVRPTMLGRLPDTIQKVFWNCDATLIVEPNGEMLPRYTCIAHLMSMEIVPEKEWGDYSRLIVAWFQDDLNCNMVEAVHRAVKAIDWERHAENWSD